MATFNFTSAADFAQLSSTVAHGDTVNVAAGTYQISTRIKLSPAAGNGEPVQIIAQGVVILDVQSAATVLLWANDGAKTKWIGDFRLTNSGSLAKRVVWVGSGSNTEFDGSGGACVAWGTGSERLFNTIAPVAAAARAYLSLSGMSISGSASGSAKSQFYFSRADYPITFTLDGVDCSGWTPSNYGVLSSQQLTLDVQDCVVGGSYPFISLGTSPNVESFTFKRNTLSFLSTNGGGAFADFIDQLGAAIVANPDRYDIEDNIVWATDDSTGALTADSLNFSTIFGVNQRAFWYLDPSSDNAARVVAGLNPVATLDAAKLAGTSDSILAGSSATTDNKWWNQYSDWSSLPAAITGDNWTSVGGSRIEGSMLEVDRCMAKHAPKYVALLAGANNICTAPTARKPGNAVTAAQYADEYKKLIARVQAWGAIPLVLGVPSSIDPTSTGATAQGIVDDVNAALKTWCAANEVSFLSLLDAMEMDASWKTTYYAALTTGVHPNDAGHDLIAACISSAFLSEKTGIVFGVPTHFASMPPLSLAPTAPGDLRSVQCWSKVASAKEIGKY